LRPLEAEAAAALAQAELAKGDAESAVRAATNAIDVAARFSGRPILVKAYAVLGESLIDEDIEAAVEAYAQVASNLVWIQGSLLPEHVDSFMGRGDIRAVVRKAVEMLEGAGRTPEAAPLKKWAVPSPDPS
jgi:hypothetical protein